MREGLLLILPPLLPPAILTMATLAMATLTLAILTRWASLLPPAHDQTTELQQVLQELTPPPAACAECRHEEKADGEAEEAMEVAGAEGVGEVAPAEVLADVAEGGGAGADGGCAHGGASVPAVKTGEVGEEDEAALHGRITALFEQLLVVFAEPDGSL